jgi:predicted metal-dependent phosphoesterase TrpH
MSLVDLHLHTRESDGRMSVHQLIEFISTTKLKVISITDHDTTNGLDQAFTIIKQHPSLTLIPGIELSTDIPDDEIHILGYYIDYKNQQFQNKLLEFRAGRVDRAQLMIQKLSELGMHITWNRVKEIAGEGTIGRPHLALALVEKGYFTEPKQAFKNHLNRTGLAYVEVPKMTPFEGIELIKSVGGKAVLAHPNELSNKANHIESLKNHGLDGIEIFYPGYDETIVNNLLRLSQKFDLIPCGGSDYHGLGNTGETLPGHIGPPMSSVEKLTKR